MIVRTMRIVGARKGRRKIVHKDAHVNIRLTSEQKDELTAAATRAGLGVSSWLLATGLREARRGTEENDGESKG